MTWGVDVLLLLLLLVWRPLDCLVTPVMAIIRPWEQVQLLPLTVTAGGLPKG
jgi:hypothetical protein